MNPKLQSLLQQKEHIRKRMWKTAIKDARKGEQTFYAALRVGAITLAGIKENRLVNRAAALSFSSILGLIPLTAIMILVSGFVLNKTDPDLVVNNIYKGISYIAPQLGKLEALSEEESKEAVAGEGSEVVLSEEASAEEGEDKEQLKVYLEEFVEASQSGVVGVSGIIALILIVLMLFSSIEGALNDIWEVKRGRSWVMKVGMYWTVITLGTVLSIAGLGMLAAQALKWNDFATTLPGGMGLETLIKWASQIGSFLMISVVLATFYRFIPNTLVSWKASFIGAFVALICITANNSLAFAFYSNRVTLDRSLYGSLAIIPVLMMGMYIFWFFILLGGRVTYAVQNANFKSDHMAWEKLSHASKESVSLLLFSRICRRFRDCQPALSGKELAEISKLPVQFVNASLLQLCDLGLVSSIPPEAGEPFQNYKYQPAKPLDKIELNSFKTAFENHGSAPDEDQFDDHEPIVKRYHETLLQGRRAALSDLTMEDIIDLTDEAAKNESSDTGASSTFA